MTTIFEEGSSFNSVFTERTTAGSDSRHRRLRVMLGNAESTTCSSFHEKKTDLGKVDPCAVRILFLTQHFLTPALVSLICCFALCTQALQSNLEASVRDRFTCLSEKKKTVCRLLV